MLNLTPPKYSFKILKEPGSREPLTGTQKKYHLTADEAERIWKLFNGDKKRDAGFVRTGRKYILYGRPLVMFDTKNGGAGTKRIY